MKNQIEIINENQRDVELLEKNRKINLQMAKIESYQSKAFYEENTPYCGNENNKSASESYKIAAEEVKNLLNFNWGDFYFKAETTANEIIARLKEREITARKEEVGRAELKDIN
jgi:hypothetical protein